MNTNIEVRAPLKSLLNAYKEDVKEVTSLANLLSEKSVAVSYFETAVYKMTGRCPESILKVGVDEVLKTVDSNYWSRAFRQFGFDEFMAAEKREQWNKSITNNDVPKFDEEHVIPTLEDMILNRDGLIAEKVDGVYRKLSRDHKTNDKNGFYKRMIFDMPEYSSYSSMMAEAISDLIQVCAHLLGREMDLREAFDFSNWIQYYQPKDGAWYWIAGNILRARRYLKGTVHIEVHPDLAWQLNKLLSSHGDNKFAIASKFTKRATTKVKAPELRDLYLQPSTLSDLSKLRFASSPSKLMKVIFSRVNNETISVLKSLGTQDVTKDSCTFDYDVSSILDDIVKNGTVPEFKSHQFYPTPYSVAKELIKAADIKPSHSVLEPSAGNGNLVKIVEQLTDDVTAVEISPLRCQILKLRTKATVHEHDFLTWRNPHGYDRIIMNPPFTGGQVAAHISRAATMLNPNGKLVAVVPAGFKADIGVGYTLSNEINNAFDNTSISVKILETKE